MALSQLGRTIQIYLASTQPLAPGLHCWPGLASWTHLHGPSYKTLEPILSLSSCMSLSYRRRTWRLSLATSPCTSLQRT